MPKKGKLFIISGPSGSGKSTLIRDVLERLDNFEISISATTRPKRENEKNGRQYFFMAEEEFMDMAAKDMFLEWARYHGHLYGTPKEFVNRKIMAGVNIILEIEVQGARQIMEKFKDHYSIFITTTSTAELKERLEKRGTDTEEAIRERVKISLEESGYMKYYDCIIVNSNYNETLLDLMELLNAHKGGENK